MSGLTLLDGTGSVEGHKKELAPPKRGKLSARLALVMTSTQTRISYNQMAYSMIERD